MNRINVSVEGVGSVRWTVDPAEFAGKSIDEIAYALLEAAQSIDPRLVFDVEDFESTAGEIFEALENRD